MEHQPRVRQVVLGDEDITTREVDGQQVHSITIFRNEKARSGPELILKGMSVSDYRKNPTVQWAHDTAGHTASGGLPIARTLKLDKGLERIVADFTFLQGDPFASRVENAWDQGFIRSASLSWLPKESERIEGEPDDWFGNGWRDTKSELLEWSLVAVPADPGALREAYYRSLGVPEIDDDPFNVEGRDEIKAIIREVLAESEDPPDDTDERIAQMATAVQEINANLKGE